MTLSSLDPSLLCPPSNSRCTILSKDKENKTTTEMANPLSDPPAKEMKYLPRIFDSLPSDFTDFRRVLWTGLYSQLVTMAVPVEGDIGQEVCFYYQTLIYQEVGKRLLTSAMH